MRNNKRVKKKNNRGITLIALVITIIVLLILAGVSIATLTGDNGILSQAKKAAEETKEGEVKERINLISQEWMTEKHIGTNTTLEAFLNSKKNSGELDEVVKNDDGTFTIEKDGYEVEISAEGKLNGEIAKIEEIKIKINLYKEDGQLIDQTIGYDKVIMTVKVRNKANIDKVDEIEVKDKNNTVIDKELAIVGDGEASFKVDGTESYTVTVKATVKGVQKEIKTTIAIGKAPVDWQVIAKDASDWYAYTDVGTETKVKVNAPKLAGQMAPIKYIGDNTQTGSKWANAITADGSMWVWIPRYAYKITENYHSATAGKIEVAFIDANNQFLNNGDSGEITEDPAEQGAGQEKWLVHPAFTSSAKNGGGFGNLDGIWVGKFEATGTKTEVSVKPGVTSLVKMTVNEKFRAAQKAKYGETVVLGSHMAKNSEWGATVYLAYSKYGTNRKEVAQNTLLIDDKTYTGGTTTKKDIYIANKMQSTTHNATGVYDLVGGATEYVAAYPNFALEDLNKMGGSEKGDLCGNDVAEKEKSTEYKTVYGVTAEDAKSIKGDAIYETSGVTSDGGRYSWDNKKTIFPASGNPFFLRGVGASSIDGGMFYYSSFRGEAWEKTSFRPVLAF